MCDLKQVTLELFTPFNLTVEIQLIEKISKRYKSGDGHKIISSVMVSMRSELRIQTDTKGSE